jgi:glyoxylase-like metal-dependent hydrolase (beta-lactamase superfamily II)
MRADYFKWKGLPLAAAAAVLLIACGATRGAAQNSGAAGGFAQSLPQSEPQPSTATEHWTANLDQVRRVAALLPGARPLRINMLKFAESHRTKDVSVKGAPVEPSVQARTVFQVVYGDGTVMIDSGMDQTIHKLLGRGAVEPYFPEAAQQVNEALRRARVIVMTHEHGDHVAGVVRPPLAEELAPKTVLTRTQVDTLLNNPQFPEIKLTPEAAARYTIIDYDKYAPFAPGMALIKSPGHTPGSQMIYVALQSGKEYLFIGDVAWHMDGVRLMAGKNAPFLPENQSQVMDELKWLHELLTTEKNLVIVASHDDEEHKQLVADHLLGGKLE